jgi:hypothetical protein
VRTYKHFVNFMDSPAMKLREATAHGTTPEHYGATLSIALPNWHILLGTRKVFTPRTRTRLTSSYQHEKLCVIDETIAFMGGIDLCFGRFDVNSDVD